VVANGMHTRELDHGRQRAMVVASPPACAGKGRTMRKHIMLIASAVITVITVVVRFSNPDMTETRLFIAFWPLWIALCVVAIGAALIARHNT
jgi:protein-S-isoprenylcysteine O-methyltransferase Ste14